MRIALAQILSGTDPAATAEAPGASDTPAPAAAPAAPPDSAAAVLDRKAVKKMKPKEVKKHLKARGLSTQGNKKEIVARLLATL